MSTNSSELLGFLRSRHSLRKYAERSVPKDAVEESVKAAAYAPRAGNTQHWRIIALQDKAMLSSVADSVQSEITRQREAVTAPRALAGFDGYTAFFTHFRTAPLVLVIVTKPYDSIYTRIISRYLKNKDAMGVMVEPAVISAAMAAQNLMLALHAQGIGTCYLTGPLIIQQEIEKRLNVDEPEHITGLITAGYPPEGFAPAEEIKRRAEKASDLVRWM